MPGSVVTELRARGHDVFSVKESMRGADDVAVLARAQAEVRIVITQDKDFGELAYRIGLPAGCGVILFRLAGNDPDADGRRMVAAVESRSDWSGGVCSDYSPANPDPHVTPELIPLTPARPPIQFRSVPSQLRSTGCPSSRLHARMNMTGVMEYRRCRTEPSPKTK